MYTKINDYWNEVVTELILEQYKYSEKFKAVLKSVIDKIGAYEQQILILAGLLDFVQSSPTGEHLDFIAGLVNIERMYGESDSDFLARFRSTIAAANGGTPDAVIDAARWLSGDESPHYMDEMDCHFFVYTPNGRQIRQKDLKRLSPVGVTAMPGAAICTSRRKKITDARGRIILAVGNEDWETRRIIDGPAILAGNDGEILTDEHDNAFEYYQEIMI